MAKKMLVLVLLLVLTGCSDPVRVEKANAVRRQSEAQYMATATAVAIEEKADSIAIAATATAIADNEAIMAATRADRIANEKTIRAWVIRFGLAYVTVLLLAFCIIGVGGSVAAAKKADLEARLVRIDRTTRTWPALLDTKTGLLVNLETGERARLTDANPADMSQLAISGQARTAGLLAQAAVDVAKTTKDAKPGDMLPAIVQSTPLLAERGGYAERRRQEYEEHGRLKKN